jgi:hypothetical protein
VSRRLRPTRRCLSDLLTGFALASALLNARPASEVAAALKEASFDTERCWRIRDLQIVREEIKVYLTDGFLIFSKPVAGQPVAALFVTEVEGGDGEIILMPPTAGERQSLARFTQSPNLNEHFKSAFFLFTDGTAAELEAAIKERAAKPSPEMGTLLANEFSGTLRNLLSSFEIRLIHDLTSEVNPKMGLFFAALGGTAHGNFDVIHDPQARDQIVAGQIANRDNRTFYNIWTSFPTRRLRNDPSLEPAEQDFKIETVTIDAEIAADLQLSATTTLKVRVPEGTGARRVRNAFAFDISRRVRVREVKIDGKPATVLQRENLRSNLLRGNDNELFLVACDEPLTPGEHIFEFRQEGNVVLQAGNGVYFVSARGTWYPHHGLQFAEYDLTIKHPKHLTVVATGDLVEERLGEDYRVTKRRITAPVRLAGFNLGEYKRTAATRGGLQIEIYANKSVESGLATARRDIVLPPSQPPGIPRGVPRTPALSQVILQAPPPDPTAQLGYLANEVAEAFDFLSKQLGAPPLKTLAVSPIPGTFGQGFPGLIYLSTISYLPPRDRPAFASDSMQQTFFSDLLVAHEVAHQWWGNAVSTTGYRDEWIMEALANYSALMLLERKRGAKVVDDVLARYREHLTEKRDGAPALDAAGPIRLGARLESSETPGAYRALVYEKGTWIVHMLRKRLGDAAFNALLKEIYGKYARQRFTTGDLRTLAAAKLPAGTIDKSLENFFAAYVEGTGIPALTLRAKITRTAKGATAAVEIDQAGVDEDFSIDVPVEIDYGRGKVETRWVRTDGARTGVTFALAALPLKVSLDSRNTILMTRP